MQARRRLGAVFVVAAGVIAFDQLTKHLVVASSLADGRIIHLFWTLRLNLHKNDGLAFSMATGRGGLIALVGAVVLALLVRSVLQWPGRLPVAAAGLVVGGALGNIVDRVFRAGDGFLGGAVIDFIDPQWWPVFNVADIGVSVGGVLLILSSFLHPEREPVPQPG
jgi:signal peptidase II